MKLNPIGPNQTEVIIPNGTVFFSYKTPVAACVGGKFYKTAHKWSRTTSRHINAWLAGAEAETKPQEWFDNIAGC